MILVWWRWDINLNDLSIFSLIEDVFLVLLVFVFGGGLVIEGFRVFCFLLFFFLLFRLFFLKDYFVNLNIFSLRGFLSILLLIFFSVW